MACVGCNGGSTLSSLLQRSRARSTSVEDARPLLGLPCPPQNLSAEACLVGGIVRHSNNNISPSLCAVHSRSAVPAPANTALSLPPPSVVRLLSKSVTAVLNARLRGCQGQDCEWHVRNFAANYAEHKRRWLESHGYRHDHSSD